MAHPMAGKHRDLMNSAKQNTKLTGKPHRLVAEYVGCSNGIGRLRSPSFLLLQLVRFRIYNVWKKYPSK